ncbi:recombinase RecT [Bradyrhizobium sp. HKCCYLS2038]|uniref:recombinase RecT n=1 Tax=Bradyrhizobium sp. HKCCYLS2038 TaxID=3420764 RepID=UPI003EC0F2FB
MTQTATLPAQVDRKPPTLRDHLNSMTPEFKKALPGHITAERFVRTAQTAIALTRNIDKVKNPQSLLAACTKAAADGLILDGREAALVVDHNGDVQYRPMMRGLLKLAYQSGQIKSLVVEVVREKDKFTHEPTNAKKPVTHKVDHSKERGEAYAVYAIAELISGGIVHEVMNVSDVNAIRDRSDAYRAFKANKIRSTPWVTDWAEMARKTVFRRISKYLPSSTDRDALHQAAERIDDDYTFEQPAEPGETPPATQFTAPKKRGGAAAILKDVTPTKAKPEPKTQPDHDPDTGEVFDQDEPDQNDPRFSNEGPQPGDDI